MRQTLDVFTEFYYSFVKSQQPSAGPLSLWSNETVPRPTQPSARVGFQHDNNFTLRRASEMLVALYRVDGAPYSGIQSRANH